MDLMISGSQDLMILTMSQFFTTTFKKFIFFLKSFCLLQDIGSTDFSSVKVYCNPTTSQFRVLACVLNNLHFFHLSLNLFVSCQQKAEILSKTSFLDSLMLLNTIHISTMHSTFEHTFENIVVASLARFNALASLEISRILKKKKIK